MIMSISSLRKTRSEVFGGDKVAAQWCSSQRLEGTVSLIPSHLVPHPVRDFIHEILIFSINFNCG